MSMEQHSSELQITINQLLSEILPRTTETGFPSQYTLQTFNNNQVEQQIELLRASTSIKQHLDQIQQACNLLKDSVQDYQEEYFNSNQPPSQQQQQQQQAELTEEDKLLRDILLLHKEIQTGEAVIATQHQRLLVAQAMLNEVSPKSTQG